MARSDLHNDDWFPLAELSARLGGLIWVEQQLSQTLQRWSALEPVPAIAVYFATAAGHHGWHDDVISRCLPTSPQLGGGELVGAPSTGWTDAFETLAQLTDPDATSTRMRCLVKAMHPWLDREIRALRDLARPVSDAAIDRWLRFVEIDHVDDGARAADLLQQVDGDSPRLSDHAFVTELAANLAD